jgi:hypothetical protein
VGLSQKAEHHLIFILLVLVINSSYIIDELIPLAGFALCSSVFLLFLLLNQN